MARDFGWRKVPEGYVLFLPLCPSVNKRQTISRTTGNKINTRETRDYLSWAFCVVGAWRKKVAYPPIAVRTELNVWIVLPRTSCDPHNYEKVFFDALEKAGICTNDRHLYARFKGIEYDKNPSITVELPCSH